MLAARDVLRTVVKTIKLEIAKVFEPPDHNIDAGVTLEGASEKVFRRQKKVSNDSGAPTIGLVSILITDQVFKSERTALGFLPDL
jgi:hypothetical protein